MLLFYWVATLGISCLLTLPLQSSQLQETGVGLQNGVWSGTDLTAQLIECVRLSKIAIQPFCFRTHYKI